MTPKRDDRELFIPTARRVGFSRHGAAERRARNQLATRVAGGSLGIGLGAMWRWALHGMTGPVIAATVVTVVTGLLIALVVAATAHTKETA